MLIEKTDPMFKTKGIYTIMVQSIATHRKKSDLVEEKQEHAEFHYVLKYSVNDKTNELVYGLPDVGFLHGNSKCFHTDILPNTEHIILTKSLSSRTLSMYVSICMDHTKEFDLPSPVENQFEVSSESVGIIINKKQIA